MENKTRQKPDDVVEMPQAFDVQSFVLLFSCRAVTASGYTGFCQVCASFHGSYFSSFHSNLRPVTIHQKVIGSSQVLSHPLLQSLANSKPPFLTLLQGTPCCQNLPVTSTNSEILSECKPSQNQLLGSNRNFILTIRQRCRIVYILEDSNQQVYQQDICYQEVTGHDSRSEPGPWDARRKAFTIIIIKIVPTGS